VSELIGTGGKFADIAVEDTAKGYLTPKEWHDALVNRNKDESIVIDCRNTKECQIGHFQEALDPGTTTFAQFPKWVEDHAQDLKKKKVFMYCTGGIRCEKASAYIRTHVSSVGEVQHLQGGIHKYLEEYGKNGLWKGKNFVFDGRTAASATETKVGVDGSEEENNDDDVVGKCGYCTKPYDVFHPENVCTVCREPTLVCTECKLPEVHCRKHYHLRACYFTCLDPFNADQLLDQLQELNHHLNAIAVGRKFKQRRKTLQKQCDKIRSHMEKSGQDSTRSSKCRNCGDSECSGACWGFHSLKRKERLEGTATEVDKKPRVSRPSASHRQSKQSQRQRMLEEVQLLGLKQPPSAYRDPDTQLRVPPPCARVLQTNVKGKWCGRSALAVVQEEFVDVAKDLDNILQNGLLRVNNTTVLSREHDVKLKNMDTIQRLVHWHEPPIVVPISISVQHIELPEAVKKAYSLDETASVIVCNKPSTVPVHPTGPYLANSLTMMVEAQEGLNNLNPCHRIDRATSGLTICSSDVSISRLVQGKMMEEGCVKKLYVAKVKGHFSAKEGLKLQETHSFVTVSYSDGNIHVSAPIDVLDPSTGVRHVAETGKKSESKFRLCRYDEHEDSSLILCYPVTGRGHQLRVHLQTLGHPIVDDILYGGGEGMAHLARQMDESIAALLRSTDLERTSECLGATSSEDAQLVKSSCRCCIGNRDGVKSSFTDAQLLGGGQSIHLHAFRYEINFRDKRNSNEPLGTLQMEVELPDWAVSIDEKKLLWLV
jgi:predicted sulfurtransferase/23S rRNA-/tRNA-specific pseudouridylate synthase